VPKKITYEFVKNQFENEGYELISKEYKGSYEKLDYICPSGHVYNIKWYSWQQGKRCFYCASNVKHTIEFIRYIDYIKKHCDPDNLITLCNSCNTRANFNRRYYTWLYKSIMNLRCSNE
jgi:5-methylcytosine-specific restriction endonuclease McrA